MVLLCNKYRVLLYHSQLAIAHSKVSQIIYSQSKE